MLHVYVLRDRGNLVEFSRKKENKRKEKTRNERGTSKQQLEENGNPGDNKIRTTQSENWLACLRARTRRCIGHRILYPVLEQLRTLTLE